MAKKDLALLAEEAGKILNKDGALARSPTKDEMLTPMWEGALVASELVEVIPSGKEVEELRQRIAGTKIPEQRAIAKRRLRSIKAFISHILCLEKILQAGYDPYHIPTGWFVGFLKREDRSGLAKARYRKEFRTATIILFLTLIGLIAGSAILSLFGYNDPIVRHLWLLVPPVLALVLEAVLWIWLGSGCVYDNSYKVFRQPLPPQVEEKYHSAAKSGLFKCILVASPHREDFEEHIRPKADPVLVGVVHRNPLRYLLVNTILPIGDIENGRGALENTLCFKIAAWDLSRDREKAQS